MLGKNLVRTMSGQLPQPPQPPQSLIAFHDRAGSRTAWCPAWRNLAPGTEQPRHSLNKAVRVVLAQETTKVRRQLNQQLEEVTSTWLWVTSLPADRIGTEAVVKLGHGRWAIENQGFNEAVNRWHSDRIFKHDAVAILVFWLMCMIAYNVFQWFFHRNLKPAYAAKVTMQHVAHILDSCLYQDLPEAKAQSP